MIPDPQHSTASRQFFLHPPYQRVPVPPFSLAWPAETQEASHQHFTAAPLEEPYTKHLQVFNNFVLEYDSLISKLQCKGWGGETTP